MAGCTLCWQSYRAIMDTKTKLGQGDTAMARRVRTKTTNPKIDERDVREVIRKIDEIADRSEQRIGRIEDRRKQRTGRRYA